MSIKISAPEFLIAASCILFCTENTAVAAVFASLGVFGAIARVALEKSIRTEKMTHEQELRDTISRTISAIVESVMKHAILPPHDDLYDDDTSIN